MININWSMDQLINWSIDQLINWSIDRSIDRSINRSIDRSINRSIDRSIDRSINRSIDRSIDQSIDLFLSVFLYIFFLLSMTPCWNQLGIMGCGILSGKTSVLGTCSRRNRRKGAHNRRGTWSKGRPTLVPAHVQVESCKVVTWIETPRFFFEPICCLLFFMFLLIYFLLFYFFYFQWLLVGTN